MDVRPAKPSSFRVCWGVSVLAAAGAFLGAFIYLLRAFDEKTEWMDYLLEYLDEDALSPIRGGLIMALAFFAVQVSLAGIAVILECCPQCAPSDVLRYAVWILLALSEVPPFLFSWIMLIVVFKICGFDCSRVAYAITATPASFGTVFLIGTCISAHFARPSADTPTGYQSLHSTV
jgi:hypothetical protein